MSSFETCPICKKYDWRGSHKCAPVWYVARKNAFDFVSPDAHAKVFANDVDEAAEKWAERNDFDGDATGDFDVIIYEEKTEQFFEATVTGEVVIEYRSRGSEQITLKNMLEQKARAQKVLDTFPEEPKNNRARYEAKQELEFANAFIEAMQALGEELEEEPEEELEEEGAE